MSRLEAIGRVSHVIFGESRDQGNVNFNTWDPVIESCIADLMLQVSCVVRQASRYKLGSCGCQPRNGHSNGDKSKCRSLVQTLCVSQQSNIASENEGSKNANSGQIQGRYQLLRFRLNVIWGIEDLCSGAKMFSLIIGSTYQDHDHWYVMMVYRAETMVL